MGDGTQSNRLLPVQVSGLTGVTAIAAGEIHSLALKSDGTVWAWGSNDANQLGLGGGNVPLVQVTPVQVLGSSGVVAIAAGARHSLALKSDGTVWMWGDITPLSDVATPVQVPGTDGVGVLTGVVAIAGGHARSIALLADGTLRAWGLSNNGQLGNGGAFTTSVVAVSGLSNVVALAPGSLSDHMLAVKSDGTVWAWGSNSFGQLGDGTAGSATSRSVPAVVPGLSGVVAVAAGQQHSVALKADGTLRAWGFNGFGQLGDSTGINEPTPAAVLTAPGGALFNAGVSDPNSFASQTDVAINTLATSNTVTLTAIGTNVPVSITGGQYSVNGGAFTSTIPNAVVNNGDTITVRQTASSSYSTTTVAVLTVGGINKSFSVTTFAADTIPNAFNFMPQANDTLNTPLVSNSITVSGINAPTPISVTGGRYSVNGGAFTGNAGTVNNGDVVTVQQTSSSAFNTLTAATLSIGSVSAVFDVTTQPAGNFTVTPQVVAGSNHTVGLKSDGTVWTWGLGSGALVPVQVSGLSGVKAVAAGKEFTLALRSDGTVWAWGRNLEGELGDGTQSNRLLPVQVSGLTGVTAIAAGEIHSLALKSDGTVWAWGSNDANQLGLGGGNVPLVQVTPVQVLGSSGVVAIAAGARHSLALKSDGTVWMWGDITPLSDVATPVQVPGTDGVGVLTGVVAIAGGHARSIALLADGTLRAWGLSNNGQLGNGGAFTTSVVAVSGLSNVVALAPGSLSDHMLAVKSDGTVWAWGSNSFGQLGDGTAGSATSRSVPAVVPGLSGVVAVAAGQQHSVALKADGTLRAWGFNGFGQLGDSTGINEPTPAAVLTAPGGALFNAGVSDPNSFASQTDVAINTLATSNTVTLTAIGTNVPVSITGGQYSVNGGAFTSTIPNAVVNNGDTITVRQTASSSYSTTTVAVLTVGGINKSFSVTTFAADTIPNAFNFMPQANDTLNTPLVSNSITVSGINAPTPISVTGGQYSVNGGAFTGNAGTVNNGDVVTVQQTSSSAFNTLTAATLSIGSVSAVFDVTTQPAGNFTVTPQVVAGSNHTVGLKSDGTVWTWGLGSGALVPVQVSGLSGVKAVAAGKEFTLALRSDGTVWAWGRNLEGELGDGTQSNRLLPVQVSGLTGVTAIAAGEIHSLALKSDGTVWAWGSNDANQLGLGGGNVPLVQVTPVQVLGSSGVVAIAAGARHSLALKSDGTVWMWGDITPLSDVATPVQVPGTDGVGVLTGVVAIAGGHARSIALLADGTLRAWGLSNNGQLGNGGAFTTSVVAVSGLSNVVALAPGSLSDHMLAVKSDGTVWAWGSNSFGQLGDGTAGSATSRSVPAVVPGLSGVVAVAAGQQHSVALKADGTLRAWGFNGFGQLGDSTQNNRAIPSEVLGVEGNGFLNLQAVDTTPEAFAFPNRTGVALGTVVISSPVKVRGISAPSPISVASTLPGAQYSVNGGAFTNVAGTVNNGDVVTVRQTASASFSATTVATVTIGGVSASFFVITQRDPVAANNAQSIAAGDGNTLLVRNNGTLWAWGYNGNGQIGNGSTLSSSAPQTVSGLTNVIKVAAGQFHTLALKSDGTLWAFGWNGAGQIGDNTAGTSRLLPVQVVGAFVNGVAAMAAGAHHSVAVDGNGNVWTWGSNSDGQLGIGNTTASFAPVQVSGLTNVVAVAAGERHTLALTAGGLLFAWGSNQFGQLGDGTNANSLTPIQVSLTGVAQIAGGTRHTLALRTDGSLWAWGNNSLGQLGDGTITSRGTPALVSGLASGVTAIAAGQFHSLAVKAGALFVWGNNSDGEGGDDTKGARRVPVAVPGLSNIVAVAGGGRHTVALSSANVLYAFGDNVFGQVGNRTGNFSVQSLLLNVLRGDLVISGLAVQATTSVGAGSTLGSGALDTNALVNALTFGPLAVGVKSVPKVINYTNATTSPLVSIKPTVTAEFDIDPVNTTCNTVPLAPSSSCNISITHTPAVAGTRSGELDVTSTDDKGNAQTSPFSLTGTATGVASAAVLSITPTSLVFGSQNMGTTSAAQVVTITNTGNLAANFSTVNLNGVDFGFSTIDCAASLAAGASCTASISFSPTSAGVRTGQLIYTTNAANSPTQVNFTGTGIAAPIITVSSPGLSLGSLNVGSVSATQVLTISNTGALTANLSTLTIIGTNAGDFALNSNTCGSTLLAGANCTIGVNFTPSAGGTRSASLTVTSNAANGPTNSVTLTGAGLINQVTLTVVKAGTGSGTVTSSPAGINCAPTCAASFASGSTVTLTTTPAAGSVLGSWTGCDAVVGTTCTISSLAASRSVTATFNQSTQRAFVSATGNDANTATLCAVTAPCKTFKQAVTVVADNGEVVALNTAPYGSVTLTRSISLTAAPGVYAGISVFAGSGVTIASPNISVVLRGLTINGQGGANGILVDTPATGAKLSIENCVIANFANPGGAGVAVNAPAQLRVVNTLIRDSFDGVSIAGGATAVISGSKILENADTGILVNGASATVINTVVSASGTGIATAASGAANIAVTGSAITNNGTGVISQGAAVFSLTNSMVTGNTLGLSQSGTAALELLGNNTVRQNGTPSSGTITTVPRM